VLIEIQSIL